MANTNQRDFSNFKVEYGDPAEVQVRVGGQSITDQHPFQGETFGTITSAECREVPEGFDADLVGKAAIDVTFSCNEEGAQGKRVTKMFIMEGNYKTQKGEMKPNIDAFRQLVASIASANPEVDSKEKLEAAARALYASVTRSQQTLPALAKWLVGKTAYYTIKDKEITPKRGGSGRTFSSSAFEYISNRLTYDGRKKDGRHHRANEGFVAALAAGQTKESLADSMGGGSGGPAEGVADFSKLLGHTG